MTVNSPSGSTLQCDTWLWDDMPINSTRAAPCNVTHSSGIMRLNSPGSSTLQCGRWLCDDMPLTLHKHLPYWNSASGFDFDHITAVDMSLCNSLRNFIQSDHPRQKKMTSCRISRWWISAIFDFKGTITGSFKSPCTTSCRWSIETITLNWLVFEKIALLHFGIKIQNGESSPSCILGVP